MDKKDKSNEVEKKATDKADIRAEEVIREALKKFVLENNRERHTDNDLNAMVSTCSEFMKSFIIMGYDFQGNAIKPIFYAKSDIEADALAQYVQKFFISQMH